MSHGDSLSDSVSKLVPAVPGVPLDVCIGYVVADNAIRKVRKATDLVAQRSVSVERGLETGREAGSFIVEPQLVARKIEPG